ncbi:hypothetical protein OAL09_04790 [Verrucomicrobia bacterium]|nr:hypothetical protein [Verrucomicrobiota bacterium]
MDSSEITIVLESILSTPTAPFHEYHVLGVIESLLKSCHSARIERDSFGNLIVIVGPDNKAPKWIFGAHMDHPGFVELPNSNCGDFSNSKYRDKYVFLGGVPDSYLETKFPIKEFDRFAMWDLPSFQISNDEIRSRACDDLVGCSAIVSLIKHLDVVQNKESFGAVFTRSEEVGFVGATKLAEQWPFRSDSCFVSIETSVPVGDSSMGKGPICRVGDRMTIFDNDATESILLTGKKHEIPVQRALLDGGACEASALSAFGIKVTGISVPLGNYHNCTKDGKIDLEYVKLKDVESLVDLMVALIKEFPNGPPNHSVSKRHKCRGRVDKMVPFIENTLEDFSRSKIVSEY